MRLVSPVITLLQRCGTEYALDSQLVLQCRHILYHCLQCVEGIQLVQRSVLCRLIGRCKVCICNLAVYDDAPAFQHVAQCQNLAVFLHRVLLVCHIGVKLCIRPVTAVLFPVAQCRYILYYKNTRSLRTVHSCRQCGFILTGSRCLNLHVNTCLSSVSCRYFLHCIGDLGFEVQHADCSAVIAGCCRAGISSPCIITCRLCSCVRSGVCSRCIRTTAACKQGGNHCCAQ